MKGGIKQFGKGITGKDLNTGGIYTMKKIAFKALAAYGRHNIDIHIDDMTDHIACAMTDTADFNARTGCTDA